MNNEDKDQISNQKPPNKSLGTDGFIGKFHQTCKDEFTPVLLKLFPKIEKDRTPPNSFYEASLTLILKPHKDTIRKENYRSVSLMNMDTKIHKDILANQIHNSLKGYSMIKRDSSLGGKIGLIYIN